MRVKKRSVSASDNSTVIKPSIESFVSDSSVAKCKYDEAIDYIHSAINSLGACAKDDEIAKESIANLSVVLLDLKDN